MKRVIGNIYVLTIVLIFAACQSKTKNAVLYNCPVSIAMQLHEIDISLSEESLMKLNAFLFGMTVWRKSPYHKENLWII